MAAYKITVRQMKQFQLHNTMGLIKWLQKIFSLDSVERRLNKTEHRFYILKRVISVLIIGAVDSYCFYWKFSNTFPTVNSSIVITDVVQMSYDYIQYISDLYFVYKYGRELSQEYFNSYASMDKLLDITHYEEIKSKMKRLTAVMLLYWSVVSVIDFIAWALGYGVMTSIIYCLAYVFLLTKILTNLDLTVQVLNVECRLRVIADLLLDCYNTAKSLPAEDFEANSLADSCCNKNWFYSKACIRAKGMSMRNHPLKSHSTSNIHKMKWLTRCYLLISEQCRFINKMFGIRILLNSLSLLIDMVRFLNVTVRVAVGTSTAWYQENSGYLPAVTTFLRFLFCVFILSSQVYHCERVYAQTDRIISVSDHILINKNPDNDLRASLTELRNLASSRPISFNMANFFQLSYPYLVSMISVVVTYTIILLQSV